MLVYAVAAACAPGRREPSCAAYCSLVRAAPLAPERMAIKPYCRTVADVPRLNERGAARYDRLTQMTSPAPAPTEQAMAAR